MNSEPVNDEIELRELMKTEMFAAIEFGRLNNECTQNALEATWINHLDDIMEYISDAITSQTKKVEKQARLSERKELGLDLYVGHTFGDSTDWRAKFDNFIDNNKHCIAQLESELKTLEGEE